MIRRIENLPDRVVGLSASGRVTRRDYESVVLRLLEEAEESGERLRVLFRFSPDFRGFTVGAAIQDLRAVALSFNTVERMAVVTDARWISRAVRMTRRFLPYSVEIFSQAQAEEAIAWLVSQRVEVGLASHTESDGSVLLVEPRKPLCVEDIESLESRADALIDDAVLRGVVVRAPTLPGWDSVGSFVRHMRFIRTRSGDVRRVAIAADGRLATVASKLAPMLARDIEVQRFAFDEVDGAIAWAGAEDGTRESSSPSPVN